MSKTSKELNQIQADSYVMFLKLHNLHWNVKGMQFYPIHEYTEEAYNEMSAIFDEMAERALQIGEKALVLNASLVKKSNIKETNDTTFSGKKVLEILEKDFTYFLKAFKNLSKVANSEDDATTAGIADENVAKIEKRLWMLKSTLGD